jgi:hypothetical protein
MEIDQEELNQRAVEADRARIALRHTTLELLGIREDLLKQLNSQQNEDRSERSDSRAPGGNPIA